MSRSPAVHCDSLSAGLDQRLVLTSISRPQRPCRQPNLLLTQRCLDAFEVRDATPKLQRHVSTRCIVTSCRLNLSGALRCNAHPKFLFALGPCWDVECPAACQSCTSFQVAGSVGLNGTLMARLCGTAAMAGRVSGGAVAPQGRRPDRRYSSPGLHGLIIRFAGRWL